jgi:hypothetical protein
LRIFANKEFAAIRKNYAQGCARFASYAAFAGNFQQFRKFFNMLKNFCEFCERFDSGPLAQGFRNIRKAVHNVRKALRIACKQLEMLSFSRLILRFSCESYLPCINSHESNIPCIPSCEIKSARSSL